MKSREDKNPAPDMSNQGIFFRFKQTGEIDLIDHSPHPPWGFNHVPGWVQGEYISPTIVAAWIAQGLGEQQGSKLIITEEGKKSSYDGPKGTGLYVKEVTEKGKSKDAKPHTKVVAAGKLNDNSLVKYLQTSSKLKGGEELFVKVWQELPDQTGSVLTLAEAFGKAGAANQKDPLASARYYVKRALAKRDAQLI